MPWGVVATAAVAAYGSYEEQKAQDDAREENKELTELGLQPRTLVERTAAQVES
jgi:hypothetical protein